MRCSSVIKRNEQLMHKTLTNLKIIMPDQKQRVHSIGLLLYSLYKILENTN